MESVNVQRVSLLSTIPSNVLITHTRDQMKSKNSEGETRAPMQGGRCHGVSSGC